MSIDVSQLIALVSSRVCHDLASPIQALTTALDVLESDNSPEMRESAIGLIRNSTNQAGAKVDFMRAIFGSVTAGNGTSSLADLKNIAAKFIATQKPEFKWEITENEFPKPLARVLMNLIMIAIDSLPRGGEIEVVTTKNGNNYEAMVKATGYRVNLKPAMRASLQGRAPEDGFDGRSIQPFIAFLTAKQNKIELAAREDEQSVTLIARMQSEVSGMIG